MDSPFRVRVLSLRALQPDAPPAGPGNGRCRRYPLHRFSSPSAAIIGLCEIHAASSGSPPPSSLYWFCVVLSDGSHWSGSMQVQAAERRLAQRVLPTVSPEARFPTKRSPGSLRLTSDIRGPAWSSILALMRDRAGPLPREQERS